LSQSLSTRTLDSIYDWLSQRVVYHGIAWFLYLLIVMIPPTLGGQPFWFTLSNQLINMVFLAIVVYVNFYYLIPNFLSRKRLLRYFLLLMLTCAMVTPVKVVLVFIRVDPAEQLQMREDLPLIFVSTFILALVSTLFKIVAEWIRQQRIRQDLEMKNMQSELKFLRSQINPHFLFNTLNSLYALTLKKSENAPEMVLRLSEIMRYMLYECNEKRVPLDKEVNYIRNYLEMERMRFGQGVDISFDLQGDIEHKSIAPLMFIPFLENAFKHGLSQQIKSGFVRIHVLVEEDVLHFQIENSTTSLHDSTYHRGGIGLENVRRRLEILYPDAYDMSISESADTYTVTLTLQFDE
jgi:hypothetical protein